MKCETCKKEIGEQMLGQYNKVCFSCYEKGLFFELTGYQRNQLKAARKHGAIENFKQTGGEA